MNRTQWYILFIGALLLALNGLFVQRSYVVLEKGQRGLRYDRKFLFGSDLDVAVDVEPSRNADGTWTMDTTRYEAKMDVGSEVAFGFLICAGTAAVIAMIALADKPRMGRSAPSGRPLHVDDEG